MEVGMILAAVGAVAFLGYLIWLIVRIKNWDSKIPPIIGMLLCAVMILGGVMTVPSISDKVPDMTDGSTSLTAENQSAQPEGEPQIQGSAYEITYQNAQTWVDSIGTTWVQVIVEITNTGSENLYLSSGAYDLEDENGTLITSQTMVSTYPSVLAPGEKGYMYDETTLENYSGSGTLAVSPRPSVDEAKVDLIRYGISDVSVSDGSYGNVSVLGRIENTTSDSADGMVYIIAFFYDENGTPIGSALNILTDGLDAGAKIGFELSGFSLPDDVTSSAIADTVLYAYPLQYQF